MLLSTEHTRESSRGLISSRMPSAILPAELVPDRGRPFERLILGLCVIFFPVEVGSKFAPFYHQSFVISEAPPAPGVRDTYLLGSKYSWARTLSSEALPGHRYNNTWSRKLIKKIQVKEGMYFVPSSRPTKPYFIYTPLSHDHTPPPPFHSSSGSRLVLTVQPRPVSDPFLYIYL